MRPSFSCRSTLCNDVTSGSSRHNTAEVVLSYHIHKTTCSITVLFLLNVFNESYILHSKSGTQRASRDNKRKAQHNEGYSVFCLKSVALSHYSIPAVLFHIRLKKIDL